MFPRRLNGHPSCSQFGSEDALGRREDLSGVQIKDRQTAEKLAKAAGFVVAVVGPDGIGKSTTLLELQKQLATLEGIEGSVVRHWRPGLLPPLGGIAKESQANWKPGMAPRRKKGRFHGVRLVYYGLDFLLGHCVIDRPSISRSQMVLYDRSALDMHVDPCRFGLSSRRGTLILSRIVPRPKLTILLYDTPEGILKRKAELTEEDIRGQFSIWAKLLVQGDIDAVVNINAGPLEVARRILSLIREKLPQANNAIPSNGNARAAMLERVGSILTGCSSDLTFGPKNKAPAGGEVVETYALLPNRTSPRFLIPLDSRPAAANALRIYSAQRPAARLAKATLSVGLRAGLAQPLLPHRMELRRYQAGAGKPTLKDRLTELLGEKQIYLSASMGTPSIHQKPLLQVMNASGKPIAYAKLGWNTQTRELVRREAVALQRLSATNFRGASVPAVLLAEPWDESFLLVQSGPAGEGWQTPKKLSPAIVDFLIGLYRVENVSVPLKEGKWWTGMQERLTKLNGPEVVYDAALISWSLCAASEVLGSTPALFSYGHGDFAPWNTFEKNGSLFVVDWEYADCCFPAGADLFHFITRPSILVEESTPTAIARDMHVPGQTKDRISQFFSALSVPWELTQTYLALSIADTFSFYLSRDAGRYVDGFGRVRAYWRHALASFVLRASLYDTHHPSAQL